REDGGLVATRAYYGGKVHAEVGFAAGKPTMLLLRPGTWPQASGVCTPDVVELVPELSAARTRHVEFREPEAADLDISGVDFLLSIGRGVGERGNVSTFEELADKLGATLVSSRPLVDLGWMPSSRQVGQSGKTVKPKVYLAFGISGAAHHVMGMRDSGTIIAVNSDPDATIFSIADYGVVADLFDVADELERLA
ncbi:MAG: electron transfer flavoprotein alpha subunit, partial [Actinomycetota bacterium]|nr:electron transfer flavoprotein alpha subunit [Actinomycetota bacterium]